MLKKYNVVILLLISLSALAGGPIVSHTKIDFTSVGNVPTPFDYFGQSLAYGDFNNDGYQDLAIGIPGEDFNGTEDIGAVVVINGSESGLTANPLQAGRISPFFALEEFDFFGTTLASGDFNCDGIDDLAIGVPFADVVVNGNLKQNAGKVFVYNGSNNGLLATNDFTILDQSIGFIPNLDRIESNDTFGLSLAVGNFNGDNFNGIACDDLAVGSPNENFELNGVVTSTRAGQVSVFYGNHIDTFNTSFVDVINQESSIISGSNDSFDQFGFSLAAGNFTSTTSYDDLAIGAYGKDLLGGNGESLQDAGEVTVLYGGILGIQSNLIDKDVFSQLNLEGLTEANDSFGFSLASGNLNNSGADELIVGAYGEGVGSILNAGAVHVIYSDDNKLTTTNNQIFHLNTAGLLGQPSQNDHFGSSLTVGDVSGDLIPDLVIGIVGSVNGSGAITVIEGVFSGTINPVNSVFYENIEVFSGHNGDNLGSSLVVADLDHLGNQIITGLPGDDFQGNGELNVGSVVSFKHINVSLPEIIFANSFE